MMNTAYVPPRQRLYNSRHRVSRRRLTQEDTLLDIDICDESRLISYSVPVVNYKQKQQDIRDETPPGSHPRNSVSLPSLRTDEFEDSDSFISNIMDESLPAELMYISSNHSVDSMIWENKRQIEELKLAKDFVPQRQEHSRIAALEKNNRYLRRRSTILEKKWSQIKSGEYNPQDLLIHIRKSDIYWFGISPSLRNPVYSLLVTHKSAELGNFYSRVMLQSMPGNANLALQIGGTVSHNIAWLDTWQDPNIESALLKQFPGLYFHLRDKLNWDIAIQFVRPLIYNTIRKLLERHIQDGLNLELLDIILVLGYYRELQAFLTGEFLHCILTQTHHKFFGDAKDVTCLLSNIDVDLVRLLEDFRSSRLLTET